MKSSWLSILFLCLFPCPVKAELGLLVHFPDNKPFCSGSTIDISPISGQLHPRGLEVVITAAHCCDVSPEGFFFIGESSQAFPVQPIARHSRTDVCMAIGTGYTKHDKISPQSRVSDEVSYLRSLYPGYLEGITQKILRVKTTGAYIWNLWNDYALYYGQVYRGMSGSPVYNGRGEIQEILVAFTTDTETGQQIFIVVTTNKDIWELLTGKAVTLY